jgi:hypothetical protein
MLQIDKAIEATTRIVPAKIEAGEGESGPYTQVLTLENQDTESRHLRSLVH